MKYKCISVCPEIELISKNHCVFSEKTVNYHKEFDLEICPCGNVAVLTEIDDNECNQNDLKGNENE